MIVVLLCLTLSMITCLVGSPGPASQTSPLPGPFQGLLRARAREHLQIAKILKRKEYPDVGITPLELKIST